MNFDNSKPPNNNNNNNNVSKNNLMGVDNTENNSSQVNIINRKHNSLIIIRENEKEMKPPPKKVNVPCTSQIFSISHHVLSFPTSIFLRGALGKGVGRKKIDTNGNPLPHIRAHCYFIFQTRSMIYKHSKTRELDRMYCLWGTLHT